MRWRHTGGIEDAVYSPDGNLLASAGYDGTIRLWDPATGHEVRRLVGHTRRVLAIRFTPDGARLVSAAEDDTLRVWDVASGRSLAQKRIHNGGCLAISPDGRFLATEGRAPARLHLMRLDGEELRDGGNVSGAGEIHALAFSASGEFLVVSRQQAIEVQRTSSLRTVWRLAGLDSWPWRMRVSPDGRYLATANDDGLVRLHDLKSGSLVHTFTGCRAPAYDIAFVEGGRLAGVDYDGAVFLWDVATGKPTARFKGTRPGGYRLAVSPDGRTLACASYRIRLFDLDRAAPRGEPEAHAAPVQAVAFSPDGTMLATGGDDGVRTWSTKSGACLAKYEASDAGVVAWSPDGRQLAAATVARLSVWSTTTHKVALEASCDPSDAVGGVLVAYSADGGRIAWSYSRTIREIDASSGAAIREYVAPERPRALSLGGELAVATENAVLRFEAGRAGPREVVRDLVWLQHAAWSPDGRVLATSHPEGGVKLWDARTGRPIRTIEDDGHYVRLAFSQDGTLLAAAGFGPVEEGGHDPRIRVWSTAEGKLVRELGGHDGPVACVAISPDNRLLATGGDDTTVLIWDLGGAREER